MCNFGIHLYTFVPLSQLEKGRVYGKTGTMEEPKQVELWLVEILMSTLYGMQILDDYITQPKPQET